VNKHDDEADDAVRSQRQHKSGYTLLSLTANLINQLSTKPRVKTISKWHQSIVL